MWVQGKGFSGNPVAREERERGKGVLGSDFLGSVCLLVGLCLLSTCVTLGQSRSLEPQAS